MAQFFDQREPQEARVSFDRMKVSHDRVQKLFVVYFVAKLDQRVQRVFGVFELFFGGLNERLHNRLIFVAGCWRRFSGRGRGGGDRREFNLGFSGRLASGNRSELDFSFSGRLASGNRGELDFSFSGRLASRNGGELDFSFGRGGRWGRFRRLGRRRGGFALFA